MNNIKIEKAELNDAEEILSLQKIAFQTAGSIYGNDIQPLVETLEEIREELKIKLV